MRKLFLPMIRRRWRKWAACGARLHLVDLDGALAGEGKNLPVIERILKTVKIPVELGGGIRNLQAVEKLLELGVERLILGSAAVKNPELVKEACAKYPGHIAVGIDAKNGDVAIEGWGEGSGVAATEACQKNGGLRRGNDYLYRYQP